MKYYLAVFLAIAPYFAYAQKQGQLLIDSLLSERPQSKEDTNTVKLLDLLSFTYASINPNEGIHIAQKALDLSNKLRWKKGIALAMADLGINHEARSNHSKALEYYQNASQRFEQLGDKGDVARTLANIALVYVAKSNYSKALENDFKALDINERLGGKKNCALIMENIGLIYFEQKEYAKTTEYYTSALTIYNDIGDQESIARNLGNVGIVLAARGDYAGALQQHMKALQIHRVLGKTNSIQINLANIGNAYSQLKKYPEAITFLQEALQISEKLGNQNSIAINLGNIGETYFNMANDPVITAGLKNSPESEKSAHLRHAIHYLQKAVSLCTQIQFSGAVVEFSPYLADAYFLSANYKKAFESLKQYTATKDSVFSLKNITQIAAIEEARENEMEQKELLIKDKQIQIKELTISRKHEQQKLSMACIVLLLFVVGLALKSLYVFRKSNFVLVKKEKKHLLLIEEQVDRLKKQNEQLKEIAWMQSHVIRAPLARLMGMVHLLKDCKMEHIEKEEMLGNILLSANELDNVIRKISNKTDAVRR